MLIHHILRVGKYFVINNVFVIWFLEFKIPFPFRSIALTASILAVQPLDAEKLVIDRMIIRRMG